MGGVQIIVYGADFGLALPWGALPYLAAAGEAKIALKNSNKGLKVWAVASV